MLSAYADAVILDFKPEDIVLLAVTFFGKLDNNSGQDAADLRCIQRVV